MTLIELQRQLREKVLETADTVFNVKLEHISAEIPPKTELGDLAFPIAFELAKRIKQQTGEKKNPREIAEQLKIALETNKNINKIEVAGAGYLNIFYDRSKFLRESLAPVFFKSENSSGFKRIVEHTAVNPNKAAHIGHVRNAVLGDTFIRILKNNGDVVETQNYIDNTGVQVADVVIGFVFLEKKSLAEIKKLDAELKEKGIAFDYYCWDLYAKVGQEYTVNEELKTKRGEVLHQIEEGGNELAQLADYVATRNVECLLETMLRLNIRYDLLPRESEILHLQFWKKAFEKMQEISVIRFETEGKNSGCWVMPFDTHTGNEEFDADKILVRSNGTVTYTGKDIAYQLWKLGVLGLDFNYKLFHTYADGKEVWITTNEKTGNPNVPEFGNGDTVYNVIDTRQSYPQEVVKKGVSLISPDKGEAASVHLSYDMVALSPGAALELGFELSDEDKQKSFVEMSGRKGLGVKADDLIDLLDEKALAEVSRRNPEYTEEIQKKIAHQIAVGALRYFLLKFTRNTLIVFDFKEALAFEGETGAYCQNAAVRFNSIFKKLAEDSLKNAKKIVNNEDVAAVFNSETGNDIWSLITLALRLEEIINQSAIANEPAILAKFAFNLAKAMHLFHHNHRIISEEDKVKRALLIVVADIARQSLTSALQTLGIEVPERM